MIHELDELIRRLLVSWLTIAMVLAAPGAEADTATDPPAAGDPRAAAPADPGAAGEDRTTGAATSAAARHGWGRPNRVEEFTDGVAEDWNLYDGPGHVGNGRRAPSAVSVREDDAQMHG